MRKKSTNIYSLVTSIALVFAVVCSTAYLLMLGRYNVLISDDFGFISIVDNKGALGMMQDVYINQQSRFSAFLVLGWILKVFGHSSNLIGYTVLLLLLGYGVMFYALRNITEIRNKWLLVGCGILITNMSVMAYLELSTFYWICCALYTLSSYAAIILITVIFFSKRKEWSRWIAVLVSSLYISGGAENFTPVIIAVIGVTLLCQMVRNHTWIFWSTTEQRMLLVSLLILSAGFVAVVFGPGTTNRALGGETGYMDHFALFSLMKKFISASFVFSMRLVSRGVYYMLLFPIGVLMGQQLPESQDGIWKKMGILSLIVIGIILLAIAAPVFGMGWYAPLRAYSFVSFLVSAWVVYWGILVGKKRRKISVSILAIFSSILIASMSVYFTRMEYPLVKEYHDRVCQCHQMIDKQKRAGIQAPLVVSPVDYPSMPNSYAIMRTMIDKAIRKKSSTIGDPSIYFPYKRFELTTDPNHWKNRCVQRYWNAEFEIVGWCEPNDF